jgi:hypothetical protein
LDDKKRFVRYHTKEEGALLAGYTNFNMYREHTLEKSTDHPIITKVNIITSTVYQHWRQFNRTLLGSLIFGRAPRLPFDGIYQHFGKQEVM